MAPDNSSISPAFSLRFSLLIKVVKRRALIAGGSASLRHAGVVRRRLWRCLCGLVTQGNYWGGEKTLIDGLFLRSAAPADLELTLIKSAFAPLSSEDADHLSRLSL